MQSIVLLLNLQGDAGLPSSSGSAYHLDLTLVDLIHGQSTICASGDLVGESGIKSAKPEVYCLYY
jgi:hypothetical protein